MSRTMRVATLPGRTLLFAALAGALALAPLCAVAAPSADAAEHSKHGAHMGSPAGSHDHGLPQLTSHDTGHGKQHCAPEFCCSAVVGKRAETEDRGRTAAPTATAVTVGTAGHAPGSSSATHERGVGEPPSRTCVEAPLRL